MGGNSVILRNSKGTSMEVNTDGSITARGSSDEYVAADAGLLFNFTRGTSVPALSQTEILIRPQAPLTGVKLRAVFSAQSTIIARVTEAPTITETGLSVASLQLNRNSASTSGVLVSRDPTFTSEGTLLFAAFVLGGGSRGIGIGGVNGQGGALDLTIGTDYLFIFDNTVTGGITTNISLTWIEETIT